MRRIEVINEKPHPHRWCLAVSGVREMAQIAMGMMGFWGTHPKGKSPLIEAMDRDFVFLLNANDIDPRSYTPKIMTMLDFNLWSWNSRVFAGIDSLKVRQNDRVRIRMGNLTMSNHPMQATGRFIVIRVTTP